jgi:hypothetical protein
MGNKAGSQKAFDLYNKVRVLRESPKGAVTFMTGTPISNSAVEMYTMMRYLAADELRDLGLEHFDAWRAQYVSNDAAWEPNETGRLKEVNRLGRTWSNMRSLMDLYYGFTDAVSNDDIKKAYREDNEGAEFPIPRVRGGDRQSVVIQPTAAQQAMLDHIMAAFDHLPGITDPYERNKERLRLMDRARKVSLDVRAIDPHNPSKEAGGKLEKIADEVTRLYQKWDADLGTQLVFLDRSVPKSKGDDKRVKEYDTLLAAQEQALLDDDEDAQRRIGEKLEAFDPDEMDALRQALAGGWNAYQQIKDNLIARGIPANEIRFVQEANNDEQKQALFDAVNDGRVRVLIGSTQRMGAGTNVQERLVGLHHADVTWKPSDIEQREGRIIRQGNALLEKYGMDKFEVEILAYATERTIDAKMWNLNATKLRTINGIRNYDGAFSMEFEDADSVSMAELAALASGDPLLLERVKLMADIDRLELLRRQYTRKMWGVVSQIEDAERDLKTMPAAIAGYQRDVDTLDKAWADVQAAVAQRTVEVEGKAYSTYKGAMDAVRASVLAQQAGNEDAKFTIKVGAKRATSMNGAHDAVNAALGDRFEASVDGQTLVQRVALQRIAAERATELANSLTKGEQKSVILGTMLGMPLELTVGRSQYFNFYGATLALQRADGSTLAAGNSSDGKDGQFSTALLAAPLIELERTADPDYFTRGIRSAKERIADAEKALPELLPKRDVPFAHQAELDEKMARLEDVIRQLSAKPQAAAANSAPAAPELTLTGDREPGPEPAPRLQRRAEDRKRRTEDPLFARAKNGQAGAVAQHPHPISDRALDTVIERIQAAFARRVGAALPVAIKPVRGMADLPPVLQAAARRQQLNLGKGVFFENTVYVVQQAHGTAEEVERTIFHELYGHAATASLFGGEWLAKQNALLKAIGGGAGLYRLAAANQIDLHDYAAGLQADTGLTDEQRRAIMMDELLAHLAEKKTVLRQKINEFIGAVRAWLRAHGFAKLAEYGNTDLAHLLADARKSLAAKATGRAGPAMPVFARDPDHAPVFYSTLARQIDKTVTKSASPLHWAEAIMGTSFGQQGVKQDEIHWSGVLDYLLMQQEAGVKKVDKAQLLDYLAENGVRVSETMRGTPEAASEAGIALRKSVFDQYQPQIDAANQRAWDHTLSSRENDEARDTLEELMTERDRAANDAYTLPADATSPGQYGQYQLPGGENYRELLLTLPQKAITTPDFVTLDAKGEPFGVHATEAEARNAARTIGGTYEAGASISREAVKFQSAHWTGVGNVLAHVRFNDRTDADGAKVLFIEELQSDWGQSGKRKGFAGPPATAQELRAAADAANEADLALDAARSLHAKYAGDVRYWNEKLTQLERDPRAEQQALASAHKALNEALEQKSAQVKVAEAASDALIEATRAQNALATKGNGIAPAPFVGKTEAWLSLAVKRMIAYAAQNGYDKVAFVNGKQSVERYSLEKHVKEIRVLLRPDGRYSVFGTVDDESPQRLTERAGVDAAGLADFIGQELGQRAVADLAAKDAAKRAGVQMYRVQSADGMPLDGKKYQLQMAQQLARAYGMQVVPDGKPLSNAVLDEPVDQTYSGADLRVGGEGMKTFYDKIVPNVVNDVLKKLGGGKVGPVTIDGQFSYDRLVAAGKATGKSQAELDAMPVQQRKALIDAQLRKMYPGQLGFAISDALREKALGGLPLFSRDEQRERATPGANVERLAGLLGPQLYGDMKQMGPVTVKELFQNSFDALKGALESGQLASGEINITTDPDARTITISDNGTGMTPAIINKAFLTIAGTNKETERSSGGFGIAKMLFLFGNDNLKLVTVRDGVEATLETTGAQLMKSFNDPTLAPDIVTSKTDAPSGTTVTVKIPDSFKNPSTGTSESINFPGQYEMNRVLDTSPLFEDIVVRVNGETKDIGRNFPKDDYTTFSTVKFDWGTARIIISKQEEKNYGSNVNVLSNGLWQFGFSIKENPLDYNADNIPRKMYINVEPRLKPEDAGYPFALNRQGFSPAVSDDFGKITKYLSVIYGSNKAAENAAGFGQIEYINADGSVSDKMQLAPKIDDSARQNMLQINEGDRIEIHAGRMTVNGRAVPELTANDLAQIKIDVSKFKIDQSEIDPARPMIHDNLDVVLFGTPAQRVQVEQMEEAVAQADARREDLRKVYTDLYRQRSDVPYGDPRRDLLTENVNQASEASSNADEAYYAAADALEALHKSMQDTETVTPITQLMRERFGARFDRYLRDYGRLFMSLRDAMVAEDPDHYGRMAEVAIGTSFDKEYYGVHTMTPFRGMFMNPAISAVDDEYSAAPASNTKRIATSMVATMIHEIAHFKEMNHSQRFIGEMQRVQTLLESSDTFNLSSTRQELRSILDKNHDIYQALNDTIRHADVRNRGVELSDAGAYSARNAGRADDLRNAGQAGEDDGRVAGQAGADADPVSRSDFDAAVSRYTQDVGNLAGPLFSRSPADMSRQVGSTLKALTVTSIKNKFVDYRRLALQFLGRQQLVEVYGHLFPQGIKDNLMALYNKLAMQMDAEKNDTSAQADTIATNWGKLKDHQALAELMHDATRLQIDPRKKYVLGDIKTNYTELRARYEALSPDAKAIFTEASDAYEKHYAAVKAAVHDRIGRAMAGNPNRAAMLARMDAEFFGKIKGIYFPLARFGDYMVQVNWRGANPNPAMGQAREAIHFAETMGEAQALRAELMKQYPPEQGYQVAQVTLRAEYNAARDSVGRGFLQQMFNMFKTTGMDPSLQDAINQLYLTSLPDLSWAKHGIHRKGTPGFSQDARRAFANHMFHGARYLAKLNYADQLAQTLDDMQHYANTVGRESGYDQVKAQQVIDEMLKRHDIYMNPKNNKLSNWLTSAGYVFYLGLSPASAAVNLTQTALVAYPILGGRYGFGKAASALTAASQDAVRGHNDMGKVLKGDELRAYEEWIKSGLVDVTLAHDLTSIAAGNDSALHGAMGTTMKVFSFMFHHAERFNRQATALASYRLAREQGMDHDAAYAASVQDTYASHFDYSSGNRARVMQGDVARVVLLFKQYAQNMIYTFSRNAVRAVKGDRQAAKTIAGLLTTHALAAGVLGLPVVGMLLAAASMVGGSDDEPWDAEIALRNLFADAFGDKAGEVLAHGLSRLTPWDISARVGLNSLLLPDVQEGLAGAPLAESYLTGLLGPVAGMAVNASKGMYTIAHNNDWQRGLEEMVPAFLRGPLKTLRYFQEGIKDRTGIELVPETTLAEDAGQFLGFSPSRGREAQAGKSAIYQTDKALQQRRQQLMNQYAHHVMRQEDPASTLQAIQAFNALHPSRMIAPLHLQHSVRLRMQHVAQAKEGIFLPKSRRDARAAGAFADETP